MMNDITLPCGCSVFSLQAAGNLDGMAPKPTSVLRLFPGNLPPAQPQLDPEAWAVLPILSPTGKQQSCKPHVLTEMMELSRNG